jgi:putative transposase
VTICTRKREHTLDNDRAHVAMLDAWRQATQWKVGEYMIMPDHVHFFCAPGVWEYPPIRRWAGYWKRLVGKNDPDLKGVFQNDCWDTQIRDRNHFDEKLSYMRLNPERRGLVPFSDAWPYGGHVFEVHWL